MKEEEECFNRDIHMPARANFEGLWFAPAQKVIIRSLVYSQSRNMTLAMS
jgi:hypothetical protein